MATADIAVQRLHSQHLVTPNFATPGEVVRWFGAVQAQDFFGSLYAIGLRLREATEQMVEKAIADKIIIRTWPMSGTIHFVPPEEARWMLKLLARRVTVRAHSVYRKAGLDDAIFSRGHKVIAKALEGGKQLTRSELYQALEAGDIHTGGEQRGLHILGYWAQHGLICFGTRKGKQATFTLLDDWIPAGRQLEGEAALAELAKRYFVSHGPATVQDFAWWSGLNMAEARTGLQAVQSQLHSETLEGRTYWHGAAKQPAPPPSPDVHLLPPYDEFTVAYRDRSAVVEPEVARGAGYGLGPSIILDGRMAGTWKRTRKKDAVIVAFDLFAPLNRRQQAAAAKAARRYGRFLGLPVVMDV